MLPPDKIKSLGSSSKGLFGSSRRARIISVSTLFLGACAFGAAGVAPIAPDASDLPVKSISRELSLPSLSEQIDKLQTDDQPYLREERVRSGDTLATLLSRLGVHDEVAAAFIKSDGIARGVMQLKAGRRVQVQTDKDGHLQKLTATLADGNGQASKNLVVSRTSKTGAFAAMEETAKLERRIEMQTGEIRSSLFAATDAAQIPDSVATQLVDMFSTNIDFASDLRRGDRFKVVYETFWQNGEYVRSGRVLAGEFLNGANRYQSVWFDEPNGKQGGGYYSFDGKSLKKAFLKSPLEFSRISSGFAMRVHPISGKWKQHQGVDFAAATGTPIRASGDGTVDFVGVQNGYGNVVALKHWSSYSTVYAHMSRFAPGLKKGMHVDQGSVIGYVGSTGWATGPHLHYEFRINNQPRDPLAIAMPSTPPLAGVDLQHFRAVASDMQHRFALLAPESGVKLALK